MQIGMLFQKINPFPWWLWKCCLWLRLHRIKKKSHLDEIGKRMLFIGLRSKGGWASFVIYSPPRLFSPGKRLTQRERVNPQKVAVCRVRYYNQLRRQARLSDKAAARYFKGRTK